MPAERAMQQCSVPRFVATLRSRRPRCKSAFHSELWCAADLRSCSFRPAVGSGPPQALVRDGLWFSAGSGPPQALVRDGLLFFVPGVVPQLLGSRGSRQESMQCFAGSEKQSGAVPISTPAPSIQPPKFPTHSEPMRAARDSILIRQQNTAQYRNLVCGLRTVLRQRHARRVLDFSIVNSMCARGAPPPSPRKSDQRCPRSLSTVFQATSARGPSH